MEFLVVSDSKLKIMMNSEEMKEYEIDTDEVDYDDPKVRRSFWRILDRAKEECSFQTSGDKILIQFYPSKDGCEIFITKLGLISPGAERSIAKSSKVAMLTTHLSIYKFPTFSALLSGVRMIDTEDCERVPRAYYDDRGNYYIIAEERLPSEREARYSPISEYATKIPSSLSPYVCEHSTEIDFTALKSI